MRHVEETVRDERSRSWKLSACFGLILWRLGIGAGPTSKIRSEELDEWCDNMDLMSASQGRVSGETRTSS